MEVEAEVYRKRMDSWTLCLGVWTTINAGGAHFLILVTFEVILWDFWGAVNLVVGCKISETKNKTYLSLLWQTFQEKEKNYFPTPVHSFFAFVKVCGHLPTFWLAWSVWDQSLQGALQRAVVSMALGLEMTFWSLYVKRLMVWEIFRFMGNVLYKKKEKKMKLELQIFSDESVLILFFPMSFLWCSGVKWKKQEGSPGSYSWGYWWGPVLFQDLAKDDAFSITGISFAYGQVLKHATDASACESLLWHAYLCNSPGWHLEL